MRLIEQHSKKNNEKNTNELLSKKILDFLIASFRFSQAEVNLQHSFYTWAVNSGQFSADEVKCFKHLNFDKIMNITNTNPISIVPRQHYNVRPGKINLVLKRELLKLLNTSITNTFISDKNADNLNLLQTIIASMLGKDKFYITRRIGRHKASQNHKLSDEKFPDSIHDPRASYVRKYILKLSNIKNPIFAKLHNDLSKILHRIINDDGKNLSMKELEIKSLLLNISEQWETCHPGHKFHNN
jgi:hypothetical protein